MKLARTPARIPVGIVACFAASVPSFASQDLGTLPLDTARDLTGTGEVRLAVVPERATVYVGEALRLTIVVDVGRAFLETRMVQPFRRELDVPVQVQAGWLAELTAPAARASAGPTFALGSEVVHADALERLSGDPPGEDGRGPRVVLGVERRLPTTRVGPLRLGPPTVRFAYAESFRDDLLQGRVPSERLDAFVTGEGLELDVVPLPAEGRPALFSGAVGRFEVRGEVDRHALRVGDSLVFTLVVEGEGNLERFEPPRLALAGFDVRGTLDDRDADHEDGRRVVRYDLAPNATSVAGVPPVPFAFFDPGPPAAWRVVETDWIELDVRPGPATAAPAPVREGRGAASRSRATAWIVGGALAAAVAVWFGLRRRARG